VWVVSGDYKTERDATCAPFEPVRCQVFITEATFAAPVYRWRPQAELFVEINAWWRANAARGKVSVLCAYSLGKAQRVLAGLDAGFGRIVVHPHAAQFLPAYRTAGVAFPPVSKDVAAGALAIAPSVGAAVRDLTGRAPIATAFASGWMLRRGAAKQYGVQTGFALSDHADWDGLTATIKATGAERVGVAHGEPRELLRWLRTERRRAWVVAERRRPVTGQLELPLDVD
jgi:putative mRNA 3-end processing factor